MHLKCINIYFFVLEIENSLFFTCEHAPNNAKEKSNDEFAHKVHDGDQLSLEVRITKEARVTG
jgi:hypothetical protein